ncbi:MAG TPA: ankyrin repeat domain-containing protein [Candidatus Paceibacterota bacterium]|nr:ankyrin repeat domain-containing protein [Verrucomicrobiota bacterium]HSA10941.1 ankyrin repeat domain-containing protein [Candidatus Paceibacterota bacterium]
MKPRFWKITAIVEALVLVALLVVAAWQYPVLRGLRYHFLDRACVFGDAVGVGELLHLGADPDGKRDYQQYAKYIAAIEPTAPLFHAAWSGDTNILALLLSAHANPNILNGEGDLTPIAVAAMHGHADAVRLLLTSGARSELPSGRSVIDLARQHGFTNIATVLQQTK